MEITTLNSIFTFVGIIAAFLSAFSFLGTWWTGKIIDKSKTEQVESLQEKISNGQPSIFSQTAESINVLEGELYKHTYKVSVDAPVSNILIITHLTSRANKIGRVEATPTGGTGARKRNSMLVPYQDFIYSFKTDKALDMTTDSVSFSTNVEKNVEYLGAE